MSFNLTDKISVSVDVASGNLLVRSTELTLPGLGSNVTLGAAYNSLLVGRGGDTGALGHGWRTRSGVDVRLIVNANSSVTYLAPDGEAGTFAVSGSGYTSPGEFKAALVHEATGWALTEHGSGHVLHFNAAGFLASDADRNQQAVVYAYNGANQLTTVTSNRGNSAARVATVGYTGGWLSSYTETGSDGSNRLADYTTNSSGDLVEINDPTGSVATLSYDTGHHLTKIVAAIHDRTSPGSRASFTYDTFGRVTSTTQIIDSTTGRGATTRFGYVSNTQSVAADADTDLSTAVTSVAHTTYTLDANLRVTHAVDPAGNGRDTSYTSYADVSSATSAAGVQTSNTFGANSGESLTASTATGTGAHTSIAYGNTATASNPTGNFQPSSSTNTLGNQSLYTYDGAGNTASSSDATAARAKVTYNSDGTVATSTDPNNVAASNPTSYGYDTTKQLVSITPPTGNSLGVRHYTYDPYGRVATVQDGAGRTTTDGYDLDDRVTSVHYSDSTPAVSYVWDPAGNLYSRNDAYGSNSYGYDPINRLDGLLGGSESYGYDANGNLVALTDQRGTTTYTYDTRNLLTSLVAGNATYTFASDKDGRRTDTTLAVTGAGPAKSAHTHAAFDASGRLSELMTERWTHSGGTDTRYLVSDVAYCYSPYVSGQACPTASAGTDTGIRQWQTDKANANTITVYQFDHANRLTEATNVGGSTLDYTYDADGNRTSLQVTKGTSRSGVSTTFNSANQINTVSAIPGTATYDGAGNFTSGGTGYPSTYNAAEQMTLYTNGSGKGVDLSFYDVGQTQPLNVQVAGDPGPTNYRYGLNDQYGQPALQSFAGPATSSRNYIERDQQGGLVGVNTVYNGTRYHYMYVLDGLGSVTGLVAADGTLAATTTYDPYGNVLSRTGDGGQIDPTAIGYTGGINRDNLVKLGQRWYDPYTGRFTQQDSLNLIGNPSNGNRYAYAGDNPVTNVDPAGDYYHLSYHWSRPFQHHEVMPRMANGLVISRAAQRVASVMSGRPARRRALIATLRSVARTRGPQRVRTRDWSSR